MVNLRIQGQNLYMRPILLTDMATLRTAMTGVWPGDIVPTENEGKAWKNCGNSKQIKEHRRKLTRKPMKTDETPTKTDEKPTTA